jgi:hypothetical protein
VVVVQVAMTEVPALLRLSLVLEGCMVVEAALWEDRVAAM